MLYILFLFLSFSLCHDDKDSFGGDEHIQLKSSEREILNCLIKGNKITYALGQFLENTQIITRLSKGIKKHPLAIFIAIDAELSLFADTHTHLFHSPTKNSLLKVYREVILECLLLLSNHPKAFQYLKEEIPFQ